VEYGFIMAGLFCYHEFRRVGLSGISAIVGITQVDDWRIVSAIVFVIKKGLIWRGPCDCGPHEIIDNRSFAGAAGVCSTEFP
jgi:hypothetical protein